MYQKSQAPRRYNSCLYPGTCVKCGNAFPAGTDIWWNGRGNTWHADGALCLKAKADAVIEKAKPVVLELKPIVDFLNAAKKHLKFPKARFLDPSGQREMRLSVAGQSSTHPGAIQVHIDGLWVGKVLEDGTATAGVAASVPLQETLVKIAANPAAAAKAYGALMCRCSFCNLPLTDEGSVEVGYGPICAMNFGLPHFPKGTPILKPIGDIAPQTGSPEVMKVPLQAKAKSEPPTYTPETYHAFSSDLNIPPGKVPDFVKHLGKVFADPKPVYEDGDLISITYLALDGSHLVVFND